ncbi:MAG: XRE family transcriptional regulator [Deltaproteobacteria bacterium]|nr:XRE family transcriptional regulator [Deltaproteobacteria bacterium]
MDLSLLSVNLRRIRSARGMSQGDVADKAGLSRVAYRNIESGTSSPRVDSLMGVANALDVKLQDLFVPVRELKVVRFRATKKMTTRGELLADVARWLDDYNELESLLDKVNPYGLAKLGKSLQELKGQERPKLAAARVREKVGLRESEEVRDICGLMEAQGIKVYMPKLASEGFFGLSVAAADGGPAIVVNVWERLSVERWIFTVAHELGHLLLHLHAYDVAQTEEDLTQEKEADVFASHFLMPQILFEKKLAEAKGLPIVRLVFKLKRFFRVSWKSVLYRLASSSPDGARLWARFQSEYRALTGRTIGPTEEPHGIKATEFRSAAPSAKVADEPEHLAEADFVESRLHLLVRQAIEQDEISMGRAAEILRTNLETMRAIANSWIR